MFSSVVWMCGWIILFIKKRWRLISLSWGPETFIDSRMAPVCRCLLDWRGFHFSSIFCFEEMLNSPLVSLFSFPQLRTRCWKVCKAEMLAVAGSSLKRSALSGFWGKPQALLPVKARKVQRAWVDWLSQVCGLCWPHTTLTWWLSHLWHKWSNCSN